MVEASVSQLCEFIDEYLRLLKEEVEKLETAERRSRKKTGSYQHGFADGVHAMQNIVHLETELQLAWRQLEEVLGAMKWNPAIEEFCRKSLFEIRSLGPAYSLQSALQIVQRRQRLQEELLRYLLRVRPDLLEKYFPDYIAKSFQVRWEQSLRRLRSAS